MNENFFSSSDSAKEGTIRVLQVFGKLNCGGAETMLMNLYRKIDRTKVQFDFVVHTVEKCFYEDEIENLGGRVFRISEFKGNIVSYKKEWSALFDAHCEWTLIHSHIYSTASLFLPIAKKKGLFTVIHSHNTAERDGIKGIAKLILSKPLKRFGFCDFYFACSESAGLWQYGKRIVKSERFKVINNAIDIGLYKFDESIRSEVRRELGIENDLVLGHVGRFDTVKNHSFLIEVLNEIQKTKPNTKLILVGVGKLWNDIQKKISDLNLSDSVLMLGARSDVPRLLQAMDIFVFPSLYEGVPVVLIEAQAAGIKTLISENVPEEARIFYDFVLKQSGFDVEEWTARILALDLTRNENVELLTEKGYDIKCNANFIESFYLSNSRNDRGN